MDIKIHTTVLPHTDPEASVAFYRDTLGFEVRQDVGDGTMRWITVGPADMFTPRASASTSSGCAYSRSIRSRTRRSNARSCRR